MTIDFDEQMQIHQDRLINQVLQKFDADQAKKQAAKDKAQADREAELQAEGRAAAAAEGQSALARFKEELQTQWLAAGGTDEDFQAQWPDMQKRFIERRATQAADQRRQNLNRQIREWM